MAMMDKFLNMMRLNSEEEDDFYDDDYYDSIYLRVKLHVERTIIMPKGILH